MCPPITFRSKNLLSYSQLFRASRFSVLIPRQKLILQHYQPKQEKSQVLEMINLSKLNVKNLSKSNAKNRLKLNVNNLLKLNVNNLLKLTVLKPKLKRKRSIQEIVQMKLQMPMTAAKIAMIRLLLLPWMKREERSFGENKPRKSIGQNSPKLFQASTSHPSSFRAQMGKPLRYPDTDGSKMAWLTSVIIALIDIWIHVAIILPSSMTARWLTPFVSIRLMIFIIMYLVWEG